ncbi:MAG: ABC transporter [Pseudomonadota bacterium]
MPRRLTRRRIAGLIALAAIVAVALGLFAKSGAGHGEHRDEPFGLFTSLPILWSEQADLRDMLATPAPPHWVRGALAENGRLVALDTLLDLSRFERLVIAQPRPLSPDENVALDAWVRSGGRLLMFADPMLTQESAYSLGDRRRPQDVVLLSPILSRWGLELRFDDMQPGGLRENAGEGVDVDLPGQFTVVGGGVGAQCRIGAEALVARCSVGKGRAIIVADAAVLAIDGDSSRKKRQLDAFLSEAFHR